MKTALICGGGGFVGTHLTQRLKREGYWVRCADLKKPEFSSSDADDFVLGDLRSQDFCKEVIDREFTEIYQLAADMGGAGYIFTGDKDADILHNSVTINLNILNLIKSRGVGKIFYSSSACIYPVHNQQDPNHPNCEESSAYPANPDSDYGWEKLFSERLYQAYARNYQIPVAIARFHNIFGPLGPYSGGREKAPAAICRKVAEASDGDDIEVWGDGNQTRSFLYIDECIEGVRRLMNSSFSGPVNIGSDKMITINGLVEMVMEIANKDLQIVHVPGPMGVRGRTSDNALIKKSLGWTPTAPLYDGIKRTYQWIEQQVLSRQNRPLIQHQTPELSVPSIL